MEIAGLAVGIASLAGLFDNAVHCFERIQAGRSFDNDFETLVLRLDCAQLRLARWGQATGLGNDLSKVQTLDRTSIPEEDIPQAEKLLRKVIHTFDRAERHSDQYRGNAVDLEERLGEPSLTLHRYMRKICAGRRKGTSIIRKAKWALHGRESFTKLVDDIHRLIADLTTLFASTTTKQIALCDEEAKNIPDSTVSLLKAIAAEYDTMLEAAISKLEAEKTRAQSNTWNNYDNTRVTNQGGTHTYNGGVTFNF